MDSSPQHEREFVVITGMSGAGLTTTANVLEDRGWYVVDNLPPGMLTGLLEVIGSDSRRSKLGAVVDVRTRDYIQELNTTVQKLRREGMRLRMIFVDSSDEALVRRFEAVRRPHPLQGEGLLLDGIRRERRMLGDLRASADVVVDTSNYNVHELTAQINDLLEVDVDQRLRLAIMSFGFKYGIPLDADVVLDLRFLPNPHWDPALRPFSGQDPQVRDFVLSQDLASDYLDHAEQMMRTALGGYLRENRRYVTLAMGCTGGKHRSVATSESMAARLSDLEGLGVQLMTFHRDLGRE